MFSVYHRRMSTGTGSCIVLLAIGSVEARRWFTFTAFRTVTYLQAYGFTMILTKKNIFSILHLTPLKRHHQPETEAMPRSCG